MDWLSLILLSLAFAALLGWMIILTLKCLKMERRLGRQSSAPEGSERRRVQGALSGDIQILKDQIGQIRDEVLSLKRKIEERDVRPPRHDEGGSRFQATTSWDNPGDRGSAPSSSTPSPKAQAGPGEEEVKVVAEFNALAAGFDPRARDRFVVSFSPKVVAFEGGCFSEQDGGKFWMVELNGMHHAIILPTGKVARDWEKLYRSMNGLAAQEAFGNVFDLQPGGSLKIGSAAHARKLNEGGALLDKGTLSGM